MTIAHQSQKTFAPSKVVLFFSFITKRFFKNSKSSLQLNDYFAEILDFLAMWRVLSLSFK